MNNSMIVLPTNEAPTMSSVEMVDYINADRKLKAESQGLKFPCKQFRKLEHRSFMKKAPKVLGGAAAKFFAADSYINGTGGKVERDIYNFPKREACLMAMSYSYELQAQVFDHMTKLEGSNEVNLLDFSGLTELAISEMQNRVWTVSSLNSPAIVRGFFMEKLWPLHQPTYQFLANHHATLSLTREKLTSSLPL